MKVYFITACMVGNNTVNFLPRYLKITFERNLHLSVQHFGIGLNRHACRLLYIIIKNMFRFRDNNVLFIT